MTIQVGWDNKDSTILRYDYQGTWNWNELFDVIDRANQMTDAVPYPVGAIIDLTASAGIPPGVMINARKLLQHQHPRLVIQAVVTTDRLVLVLAHTFLKLYRAAADNDTLCFVASIEEARALVARKLSHHKR
jgi:hypothetical protein